MTKQKTIPVFKDFQEEARFWDKNDFSDYWNHAQPVKLRTKFPLSKRLELRIDDATAKKLEDEAEKKGVGSSTLARIWIKERLTNL